jgi:hypothetical protein
MSELEWDDGEVEWTDASAGDDDGPDGDDAFVGPNEDEA